MPLWRPAFPGSFPEESEAEARIISIVERSIFQESKSLLLDIYAAARYNYLGINMGLGLDSSNLNQIATDATDRRAQSNRREPGVRSGGTIER